MTDFLRPADPTDHLTNGRLGHAILDSQLSLIDSPRRVSATYVLNVPLCQFRVSMAFTFRRSGALSGSGRHSFSLGSSRHGQVCPGTSCRDQLNSCGTYPVLPCKISAKQGRVAPQARQDVHDDRVRKDRYRRSISSKVRAVTLPVQGVSLGRPPVQMSWIPAARIMTGAVTGVPARLRQRTPSILTGQDIYPSPVSIYGYATVPTLPHGERPQHALIRLVSHMLIEIRQRCTSAGSSTLHDNLPIVSVDLRARPWQCGNIARSRLSFDSTGIRSSGVPR